MDDYVAVKPWKAKYEASGVTGRAAKREAAAYIRVVLMRVPEEGVLHGVRRSARWTSIAAVRRGARGRGVGTAD